jgi:hypothetical protein
MDEILPANRNPTQPLLSAYSHSPPGGDYNVSLRAWHVLTQAAFAELLGLTFFPQDWL